MILDSYLPDAFQGFPQISWVPLTAMRENSCAKTSSDNGQVSGFLDAFENLNPLNYNFSWIYFNLPTFDKCFHLSSFK
jgi:hypothetical protein